MPQYIVSYKNSGPENRKSLKPLLNIPIILHGVMFATNLQNRISMSQRTTSTWISKPNPQYMHPHFGNKTKIHVNLISFYRIFQLILVRYIFQFTENIFVASVVMHKSVNYTKFYVHMNKLSKKQVAVLWCYVRKRKLPCINYFFLLTVVSL